MAGKKKETDGFSRLEKKMGKTKYPQMVPTGGWTKLTQKKGR